VSSFDWSAFTVGMAWTLLAVAATLAITFVVALLVGRHAVVDVTWGLGFGVIATTAYVVARVTDTGDAGRGLLVAALTLIWGVRLATHIAVRSRGKGEDPRYAALLARAPDHPQSFALRRIYLTQGAVMWVVSLPVQVAIVQPQQLGPFEWVGASIWVVGFAFEAIGDWQLSRFRNDPASSGQVLDTGLWRYTRHPNYFGDATVWWGLSVIAFAHWPGPLTVFSPVLMTWLLAKGTGKPLLEKDIEERRPGYADYVWRTSGFVPLPPRRT
jgi:steroid 5-alpha reductase family enzyme